MAGEARHCVGAFALPVAVPFAFGVDAQQNASVSVRATDTRRWVMINPWTVVTVYYSA